MTQYSKAQEEYLESEVFAAGPVRRIQVLYQALIEAVGKARQLLAAKDIRGRTAQVNKAILILAELHQSLDHSAGAPVTKSLAELYDYAQRRLLEGNFVQRDEPLAEVEGLLQTLFDGWKGIPEIESSSPAAPGQYMPADYGSGDSFSIRGVGASLDQVG